MQMPRGTTVMPTDPERTSPQLRGPGTATYALPAVVVDVPVAWAVMGRLAL